MGDMGGQSNRYWLSAGMMAVGLGAAIASGQGVATAAAEDAGGSTTSSAKPAAPDRERTATSPGGTATAQPRTARGSGAERTARSTPEVRRSVTSRRGTQAAEVGIQAPRTVAVDTVVVDAPLPDDPGAGAADPDPDALGDTAYDRRRSFAETRPLRPERRSQATVLAAVEQRTTPRRAEVSPANSATASASTTSVAAPAAAPTAAAKVAAAKPVTIGSFLKSMLSRVSLKFTLPKGMQNWWRDVRQRIFGVPGRPVVVPPTEPVTPNPSTPGPVGSPPAANAPVLLWETNFTDIAEAMQAWSMQTGRWGQSAGENQFYTPDFSNVSIDANGHLVIEVRREAAPDGAAAPHNYTSARVVTYGKQSVEPPVRIVARLQMPYTQGTLPAFWMVGLEPGHEFDWPRQGEIDIVEYPGLRDEQGRTKWTGNIHGPSAADNTVDVKLHTVGADLGVDLSAGFHDYGIDWYPDRIIWHVDGVETGRVTQAQYEALGGDWTPFSGEWSHYLILNTAVGNPWTGDPDPSSQFPQAMKVDWVRVYSLAGTG